MNNGTNFILSPTASDLFHKAEKKGRPEMKLVNPVIAFGRDEVEAQMCRTLTDTELLEALS